MAAGANFFFLFVMLMLNSGGRDLVEMIPSDAYWKSKGVTVNAAAMLQELQGGGAQAPDISGQLKDLGADDFGTRRKARQAIAGMGASVLPQLEAGLKSGDPEVAQACQELIAACKTAGKAREVRRLMAIRTLGELKAKEALPRLAALKDSKEPFVGEYAAAAVAAIEGEQYARPQVTAEQWQSDVALLPADCALVGQIRAEAGQSKMTLANLAPTQMFRWQLQQRLPVKEGEVPDRRWEAMTRPATDELKQQLGEELVREAIQLAELTGNLRLEGVTVGLADQMESTNGLVTLIFRGKYDAAMLQAILATERGLKIKSQTVAGMEVHQAARLPASFIGASPERMVLVFSPPANGRFATTEPADQPLPTIVAALQAGKGKLETNAGMMKLLSKADRKLPAWGVCAVPVWFKQVPLFAAFDELTVSGTVDEQGALTARFAGTGKDAAAVQAAVDMVNKGVEQELGRMAREPNRGFGPGPEVVEMMKSIKAEAQELQATLTATAKAGLSAVFTAIR